MKQKDFVDGLNAGKNIFKFDTSGDNNGYPMLNWQVKN